MQTLGRVLVIRGLNSGAGRQVEEPMKQKEELRNQWDGRPNKGQILKKSSKKK